MDGITLNISSTIRTWVLLAALVISQQLYADSSEALRIQVASRIFPSMIAAHQSIAAKVNSDGELLILVLYDKDSDSAQAAAGEIARIRSVHSLPLAIKPAAVDTLDSYKGSKVAAIFIAEHLDESLETVIAFGRERNIITFSPFSLDVEKGVVGGILIRDRIIPYVNLNALRLSSITLRPFFIKVSETYEQ